MTSYQDFVYEEKPALQTKYLLTTGKETVWDKKCQTTDQRLLEALVNGIKS